MASEMPAYATAMADAAEAAGRNFVVGVRFHNRSWFASCGDIELDGSTPEQAVWSVISALQDRAHLDAAGATKALNDASRRESNLAAIDVPKEQA